MENSDKIDTRFSLERIDMATKTLRNTKLGNPLIEFGLMKDVYIELDGDMETAGFYSESLLGEPTISLNAKCSDHAITMALAHELRHVEQMMVSYNPYELLDPLDAVKLVRIFEADASAYSAGVANELFLSTSDSAYLEALSVWEDDDIKDAFLTAANKNAPPIITDVHQFGAAFNQWFKKPKRVSSYDISTIRGFQNFKDDILVSLFFNEKARPLNFDTFNDIGRIFTGESYLDKDNIKNKLLQSKIYAGNISSAVLRQAEALSPAVTV